MLLSSTGNQRSHDRLGSTWLGLLHKHCISHVIYRKAERYCIFEGGHMMKVKAFAT